MSPAQHLRQFGDIRCDPSRLIPRQQLGCQTTPVTRRAGPPADASFRVSDLVGPLRRAFCGDLHLDTAKPGETATLARDFGDRP
jgi:hypothetical protein